VRRSLCAIGAAALLALAAIGCGGGGSGVDSTAGTAATAPAQTADTGTTGVFTADTGAATTPTATAPTGTATATAPSATATAPASTSTAPARGDEGEIRTVIRSYIDTFLAGDGATACSLLTVRARNAFLAAVKGAGVTDCASGFRVAAASLTAQQKDVLRRSTVGVVKVTGDTGTADLHPPVGPTVVIRMLREGGSWKIANLPNA
jgi:hypothetical protein